MSNTPLSFLFSSPEETQSFGKRIAPLLLPGDLWCFSGELGSGKTTLIQGILRACGAQPPYISPTFLIIKEYDRLSSTMHERGIEKIYHLDLYRIGGKDLLELGWEDILANPAAAILVEWPERAWKLFPQKRTSLFSLSHQGREKRALALSGPISLRLDDTYHGKRGLREKRKKSPSR